MPLAKGLEPFCLNDLEEALILGLEIILRDGVKEYKSYTA